MDYIKETLAPGEEIKYLFDISVFNYTAFFWWFSLVFSIVILVFKYFQWEIFSMEFIITIVPFLILPAPKMITLNNIENGVTNRRFVNKKGVFRRKTNEIRLEAIESIQIEQDGWGRIFNYGNILITGIGSQRIFLEKIDSPLEVKTAIELVSEERENLKKGGENDL